MRIGDIYRDGRFGLSVEIFPPKTAEGNAALRETLADLAEYRPAFVSCTYGAGGTTRGHTLDWCRAIQDDYGLTATAHFTCVGSSRAELLDWLGQANAAGVHNIMALRGDAPVGDGGFVPAPDGLGYANELVDLIRQAHPHFGIGVAGYPEKHPEAHTPAVDLDNLKRKVDAGADAIFTQLFFVNENFWRFRESANAAGINVPIIPGLMPITSFDRIKRITALCGAVFPEMLATRLEAAQDDRDAQFRIGVDFAVEQCRQLLDAGLPGMHFYVLNKSHSCQQILDALKLDRASAGVS